MQILKPAEKKQKFMYAPLKCSLASAARSLVCLEYVHAPTEVASMCSMHDHACMKVKRHYVRIQHVAGQSRMLRGQVCGRRGAALTAGFAGLLPRRGGSHRRDVLTRSPRLPLPLGPCCGGCTCRLPPRAGSALRPAARMQLGAAAHMGAPCRIALEAILWCVRGT